MNAEIIFLSTENPEVLKIFDFKLGEDQYIDAYASPTARIPAFLISALVVHSALLFFYFCSTIR